MTHLPLDAARDVLETIPCGFVSFDDDGIVLRVNGTLQAMLGYGEGGLEGQHVERIMTLAGRIFYQTHLFPLLRLHGRAQELFLLLRHRDGGDIGALVNAVRLERGGRAVNDCVLLEVKERRKYEDELLRARRTAEDANAKLREQAVALEQQQRQLEEQAAELEAQSEELQAINQELLARSDELEQARAAADEANRAKSQFLTTMSHELRTPLNAIGGYVQLIEMGVHGPVTDAQREALERVGRSQRHLLRLINEVLNLARIEAGRVEYMVEDVPIAELLAHVTPMLEPQAAAAGLTVTSRVDADLIARADRDKVQQVVINLLSNAVKFTPAGGRVEITAQRDGARAIIRVADTGVGVDAAKLATIFDPFVQVSADRARSREGTGLGLAISRELARGMGGELTVKSTLGRGSTFMLALPRAELPRSG